MKIKRVQFKEAVSVRLRSIEETKTVLDAGADAVDIDWDKSERMITITSPTDTISVPVENVRAMRWATKAAK